MKYGIRIIYKEAKYELPDALKQVKVGKRG